MFLYHDMKKYYENYHFLKMFSGDIWKAKSSKILLEFKNLACLLKFFKNYHSSATYTNNFEGCRRKFQHNFFLHSPYYIKDNVPDVELG
jgi:hypothetical protein